MVQKCNPMVLFNDWCFSDLGQALNPKPSNRRIHPPIISKVIGEAEATAVITVFERGEDPETFGYHLFMDFVGIAQVQKHASGTNRIFLSSISEHDNRFFNLQFTM